MKKALALLFAVALFSVTAPAALIIDNFQDGVGLVGVYRVSDPPFGPWVVSQLQTALNPADVLGGEREFGVERTLGTGFVTADVVYEPSAPTGVAKLNTDSQTSGNAYFLYGGSSPLGANMSPYYGLYVDVVFVNEGNPNQDLPPQDLGTHVPAPGTALVLKATLVDGNALPLSSYIDVAGGSTGTKFFSWASFGGIDPSQIDKITLELISIGESPDMTIDNFRADTPEPGTYAMLGAGLAGLALLRRRAVK